MTIYFGILAVVTVLAICSQTTARYARSLQRPDGRQRIGASVAIGNGKFGSVGRRDSYSEARSPRDTGWNLFDWLAIAVLVSFSALRYGVGTDFFLYTRLYDLIDESSLALSIKESPQEYGYTTLSFVLRQFSDSTSPLLWVTSTIAVVPTYIVLRRFSNNRPLAIFLYIALTFYLTPFNVIRQGVAIALNFYSVQYVDQHRTKFVLLNVVAASFHGSVLFVAILQYIGRNWIPGWRLLIITLLASFVGMTILSSSIFVSLISFVNPRYASYVNSESLAGGSGTAFVFLAHLLLICFSLSLPKKSSFARFQVYSVFSLPFLMAGFVSTPASRLEEYFSIFLLLSLPNQLLLLRDGRAPTVLLVAFGVIYFSASLLSFGGLIPYRTGMAN